MKQQSSIVAHSGEHKALALWAAECAEHVLPFFEEAHPANRRPLEATEVLRTWIRTGLFKMAVIRTASLAAHAAAREAGEDSPARYAARAAGQAVATAHVPAHALGAALYAQKAVAAASPLDGRAAAAKEREWQLSRLPGDLREWVDSGLKQKERLLPRNLRDEPQKAG